MNIARKFKTENLPFIKFGLDKEKELESFIKNRYGLDLKETSHYEIFDFVNNDVKVELKNRNFNYNDFQTTLVGLNKIEEGIKSSQECYFLFSFADDSLFEWHLDKSKTYVGKTGDKFMGGEKYSTFNPDKLNYYLPIKDCIMLKPPRVVCLFKRKI